MTKPAMTIFIGKQAYDLNSMTAARLRDVLATVCRKQAGLKRQPKRRTPWKRGEKEFAADPSLIEIQFECRRIQATWTPGERRKRGCETAAVETPIYDDGVFGEQ